MVMKIASGVFVVVLALAVRAVYGADIVVGGESGWDQGSNYETWAAGQTFKVGDALVFNYGGTHSVAEVSEENYKACSSTRVIGSIHTGGTTSIPLSAAGPRYFLCPTAGHCVGGMKLQVNVVAATATPTAPTTPTTPTSPTSPTPPSSSTPTPPSPPSPSGASSSSFFFGPFFAAALFLL